MQFGYTIIYVENVESTIKFYEQALGMQQKFLHESKQYGELNTGNTTLAFASESLAKTKCGVFVKNYRNHNPAGFEIAFVTDDVAKAYTRALKAGAIAIKEPTTQPWGQMISYVRDLNGILVEICNPIS